jgi:trans-2-enoyl-CoA reductase
MSVNDSITTFSNLSEEKFDEQITEATLQSISEEERVEDSVNGGKEGWEEWNSLLRQTSSGKY